MDDIILCANAKLTIKPRARSPSTPCTPGSARSTRVRKKYPLYRPRAAATSLGLPAQKHSAADTIAAVQCHRLLRIRLDDTMSLALRAERKQARGKESGRGIGFMWSKEVWLVSFLGSYMGNSGGLHNLHRNLVAATLRGSLTRSTPPRQKHTIYQLVLEKNPSSTHVTPSRHSEEAAGPRCFC